MVFMRNVLVQTQYKVVTKEQVANEDVVEANKLLASLFTPEVLLNLCKVLITRYFVLTSEELEEWKDDPEEFIRETESESVQDNLKVPAWPFDDDVAATSALTHSSQLVIAMRGEPLPGAAPAIRRRGAICAVGRPGAAPYPGHQRCVSF
jgi:hypothetical protein